MSQPNSFQKPQNPTAKEGAKQVPAKATRASDPRAVQKHVRGEQYETVSQGERVPVDIGEGTFTHQQLQDRSDAREAAFNKATIAQHNKFTDDSSMTNPDAVHTQASAAAAAAKMANVVPVHTLDAPESKPGPAISTYRGGYRGR
jgi:hypothetical protein